MSRLHLFTRTVSRSRMRSAFYPVVYVPDALRLREKQSWYSRRVCALFDMFGFPAEEAVPESGIFFLGDRQNSSVGHRYLEALEGTHIQRID